MTGETISHYRIVAKLGEGGMGVVYKAVDTRLDRTVAIKVLSADKLRSPEARERFKREAKAISSLNHSHICTLYDFAHENGVDFLVMEYVDGKPLKGPMAVDEGLRLGAQIADAIDHAHRNGVTHRDLKPANILVTKAGVKLLDFGLAKLSREPTQTGEDEATLTVPLTKEGTILGTYHYMAPEQCEGKEADARSDIFAFGAVLYEMLTGQRAFDGNTPASVIAAIMGQEPPAVSSVQSMTPPLLDRTVKRCLAKDPDQRWQSAADLKEELRWIGEEGAKQARGSVSQRRWGMVALTAALVVAVGIIVALFVSRAAGVAEPPLRRFQLPFISNHDSVFNGPVISPDGRMVVYTDNGQLWVRDLDLMESRRLDPVFDVEQPFWSPDSRFVGYFRSAATGSGTLWKVPAQGGPATRLCAIPPGSALGASWTRTGRIVFASVENDYRAGGALIAVPVDGGTSASFLPSGSSEPGAGFRFPHFLPGSETLLCAFAGADGAGSLIIQHGESREVLVRHPGETLAFPVYSPTGHILYQRGPQKQGHLGRTV